MAPKRTRPPQARPRSLPLLVKEAGRAVVLLRTFSADGRPAGLGSGFLLVGGRVVTNAHVVAGAARVEVYDAEDNLLGATDYAESVSSRMDLAVLPAMPSPPGVLRVAGTEPPVGESIVVFGAPQGLANTVSTGIVSAFRQEEGQRLMQISAPISQGSSGGPVLNLAGEVVGVSVAILREGQNLNFAVPARHIRALMGSPVGRISLASIGGQRQAMEPTGTPAPRVGSRSFRDALQRLPQMEVDLVVNGTLDDADVELESAGRVDMFRAEGSAGDVFTILGVSSAFDIRVTALGVDDQGAPMLLGADDDGGGGTDARLLLRLAHTGPFAVVVASARPGLGGAYRLALFAGDVTTGSPSASKARERWVPLVVASDLTFFLDRSSVEATPMGNVHALQWAALKEPRTWDGRPFTLVKRSLEIDCARRQYRVHSTTRYNEQTVTSSESEVGPWNAWTAQTAVGEFNKQTCELSPR